MDYLSYLWHHLSVVAVVAWIFSKAFYNGTNEPYRIKEPYYKKLKNFGTLTHLKKISKQI